MKKKQKSDLHPYRLYGLPILVFLGILAVVGVVLTVLLRYLF